MCVRFFQNQSLNDGQDHRVLIWVVHIKDIVRWQQSEHAPFNIIDRCFDDYAVTHNKDPAKPLVAQKQYEVQWNTTVCF